MVCGLQVVLLGFGSRGSRRHVGTFPTFIDRNGYY